MGKVLRILRVEEPISIPGRKGRTWGQSKETEVEINSHEVERGISHITKGVKQAD